MKLVELEDRLIAIEDDGQAGALWKDGQWIEAGETLAVKAWAEGVQITPDQAAEQFPEADLEAIPPL